jgi:superfamily II DNA or RNA helicase
LAPYEVKNSIGLREWQINSVSQLVAAINHWGAAIDGSDVGVGKTYVACAVARELGMKILVVCPKAVVESWNRVICKHFKMKDQLVGIINYEQLRIGKKDNQFASYVTNRKTHRDKFTWKITKDTLIVWDESQKLKNWKTKNSKTCVEAFKQGYKMLFCSATNATTPLELRTIGTVLKLFKGSKQYYDWCYEHGVERGRFGMEFTTNLTLRKKVFKKLHRDIFVNRGCRLTRDTIPNFPESEIIADCYTMDETDVNNINQANLEMEKELKNLSKLSKRDSSSELTAILRARQKIELIKVPLFIDMIEDGLENGMSMVVFLNFTDTINAISKRLNINCIYDGKTSDSERQKNVDDFQNDKQRVILVNVASGGAGLSLHDLNGNFPRLALISPSYSAVLMRQATGRVWRDDAKTKSIQKIVFVAGTVEEQVCQRVQEKLKNLDLLNDGDLKSHEEIYKSK